MTHEGTPLIIGDEFITVSVEQAAQAALRRFIVEHQDEIDALLAPFDLGVHEIAIPDFRRLVWQTPTLVSPGKTDAERKRERSSWHPMHEGCGPEPHAYPEPEPCTCGKRGRPCYGCAVASNREATDSEAERG